MYAEHGRLGALGSRGSVRLLLPGVLEVVGVASVSGGKSFRI